MRGKIIVISGPSGVGKTAIFQKVLQIKSLKMQRVVTCTTRLPREGEVDGKDYFFITKEEFLDNIKNNEMYEFVEVYGNYYGSRKADVEKIIDSGANILFVVDVKGALSLKSEDKKVITIFINAESIEVLKTRLSGRGTDSEQQIKKRFSDAVAELEQANKFDHIIINYTGKIEQAAKEVADIISAK